MHKETMVIGLILPQNVVKNEWLGILTLFIAVLLNNSICGKIMMITTSKNGC